MTHGDETVTVLLDRDPLAARVFLRRGMQCVGCALAPFETLAEVCGVYGMPLEELLEELHLTSTSRPAGEQ
jgi:hybrid cluster-associated redox disulfide protein